MIVHSGRSDISSTNSTIALTSGSWEQATIHPNESKTTSRVLLRTGTGSWSYRTEHSHSANFSVTVSPGIHRTFQKLNGPCNQLLLYAFKVPGSRFKVARADFER